ncbi:MULTISPECIES: helix-turn-helix transcriptional regulator [unclassified Pseudovibrio]|uniref:helix-turn-helix domain-containing protein n=1 Tax=unclassified Pseudovibrio TaxID=2627060 RepID=UPI0007AE580D|nr:MULTISPECIES: helix-turn-helix transcriptional regulator [unclassified Pseudovibrio]KZK92585.1 Helix-turn-helix domain protein [Pseudovibrio sp. W74]KZL10371.1 Helix-turn-helix domain protein [Pseudovibrio sp. Ad14]
MNIETQTENAIGEFLQQRLDLIKAHTNQRDIAKKLGYQRPNIISMWKRGETKVPLDKVPALAEALGVDPAKLFRLAMLQYWPSASETVNKVFGGVVTEEEKELRRIIETELGENGVSNLIINNKAEFKKFLKSL